ncbi:hypothetical protein L7F22_063663 [Adiantum nelumboides]|nr:hypothetical protein [Adiantum nelumboides]
MPANSVKTKPSKTKKRVSSRGKGKRKRPRTHFEEFLVLEEKKAAQVSFEEDLALERRLGKKLKLKHGLVHDASDGLSDLLEGLASASDVKEEVILDRKHGKGLETSCSQGEAGKPNEDASSKGASTGIFEDSGSDSKDSDCDKGGYNDISDEDDAERLQHSDEDTDGVHITTEVAVERSEGNNAETNVADKLKAVNEPSLVRYIAPHRRTETASSNELIKQLQRRTRGLLNKLSEDNVESLACDILSLFQAHGRRVMTETLTNEMLEAICSGPRGNEQYAAVFAAFVAGIASSVGLDFGAKFLVSFAESLEEQRKRGDSLAVRNMLLLLSYLYIFKLISCGLIYDLLGVLSQSLTELDVAMILTVLQTCGMGLRADDPAAMKDFVLSIQRRCEDLKVAAIQSGTTFCSGKRMEFMLETICEIKDNKKRVKQQGMPHVRLKKWLQKLGVEEVHLGALKWKKLLDPNKKGQWWISAEVNEQESGGNSEVTNFVRKETAEAEKMLQLAALQKMNTEIRRAIFCVVMSGEDYMDAFEKLLRIKLKGKQDREIMRVIVECCLQEKVFNKYYSLLINKLCHHDKNHRFTLQYCLWDHFKQLGSMETRRLANLAHLLADLIATFSLSISVLKVVEFADLKTMTPKAILFYCITLRVLLTAYNDEVVRNVFLRIASAQELEGLRLKLSVFIHQHLMKGVADKDSECLIKRIALAKRAMAASVAM